MKQLKQKAPELTRERLVNPYDASYAERVRAVRATDRHQNFRVEELGGGYSRIVALDPSRKVG